MAEDAKTLVVNLFGGPGTGKSTNAALVFGKLKVAGIEAEIVHEFAKDLVWEERHRALTFQPYLISKQHWHVHRLLGKVDVVVTDSPILLGAIYRGEGWTEGLGKHLVEQFKSWNTLNIFLSRDAEHHPYVQSGRSQTEEEASKVDEKIRHLIIEHQIPCRLVPIMKHEDTANFICKLIQEELVLR